MKVKLNIDTIYTDDFYYDLIVGGYIKPENLLVNQGDIIRVREAIETIEEFEASLSDNIVEI